MEDLALSIYELQDGKHQVSYINPLTRKRKRHKCNHIKQAKALKLELERQFSAGNNIFFTDRLVGQVIDEYLKDFPESYLKSRKNVFRNFYGHFSSCKIKDLNSTSLRLWFKKIQEENDYSERTLNSIKSQINSLFKHLIEQGLIKESPLSKIKFKRNAPPRRPRVVLSVDDIHLLLGNAKAFSPNGLYPFLATLVHTGARRSEILNLSKQDIDFSTDLIHIKKSKNGRERFIKMSPTLRKLLKKHLDEHADITVFQNENGSKLNSRKEIGRIINKFKAFFPMDKNWGCHSLRHSFAYNFLKNGGQMYQLQAILGHRSIDVTVDLYGQLQAQDIACPSPYETEEVKQ